MKKLEERLTASNNNPTKDPLDFIRVPQVVIASGAHKYVLISAQPAHESGNDETNFFVTSKHGAHYHRNAAEPMVNRLEESGYTNIRVLGGGRISLDENDRKISIFGYSYGFGRADHSISKTIIDSDERYKNYEVTWSNDGY